MTELNTFHIKKFRSQRGLLRGDGKKAVWLAQYEETKKEWRRCSEAVARQMRSQGIADPSFTAGYYSTDFPGDPNGARSDEGLKVLLDWVEEVIS